MAKTFLDRNKKKSLLAALLLFLRERKILVLLLFLVLMASGIFLGPSSWITGFPGGARFAAGVAWFAGKMGMDVSRWGLGSDRRSYEDLLAAFRAARAGSGGPGGVGWGAFFRHPDGPTGAVPNSLDMVKGSKADLTAGGGAGAGAATVAGIVNPDDAQKADDTGVAVAEADMGGEREGLVKNAFAGGFMNGLLGSKSGDMALSGGPYAGKQFFNGSAGPAGSRVGDLARGGLTGLTPLSVPTSKIGGAARGSLTAMATKALNARATKGILGAGTLVGGNQAFSQLAEGGARDQMGTQYCLAPQCPQEYAATNSGAIYDGNVITSGFLTSSDPGATGAGLINSTVNVPPESDLDGTGSDPTLLAQCQSDLQTCEVGTPDQNGNGGKAGDQEHLTALINQVSGLIQQLPGACGNPCSCGGCTGLQNQIKGICTGQDMTNTINEVYSPCAPASCSTLNVQSPPPNDDEQNEQSLCKGNYGKCGPDGLLGAIMCMLGS